MQCAPAPLWQRFQHLRAALGGWAAVLYGANRVLQRMHPRWRLVCYCLMAQPVPDTPRLAPGRGQHYGFSLLSAPSPALAALGRPEAVLAARFAQGAQCLLATRQQPTATLAGCIWFVRGYYREDEVRLDYVLPPHSVWDFDVFVAPPERLGFVFARQWDVFDALLRQTHTRHTFSRVNLFNQASLAAHRRLGAKKVGSVLFVCLGARQLMLSSLRPYVAVGGRPRVQLPPA